MIEQNPLLGHGGTGFHTTGPGTAERAIRELQSLRVSVLAGAAANTKIALADIRQHDTVISALNNSAGTITDVTGTITIDDLRAKGTISVGTAVTNDTVTVGGVVFTLVAAVSVEQRGDYQLVPIGASAAHTAANLALAINRWQACLNEPTLSATAASNVVSLVALADGTGGNSITLAETGNSMTISGATLSGGSATGGIRSSGVTNSIILFWFDKPV